MAGRIGYYVHHHGAGHLQRALAIGNHMPNDVVLIGTDLKERTGPLACLDCPDDRLTVDAGFDGHDAANQRPNALHYAPVNHQGIRERAAIIADWIATEKPPYLVIDVSVEIAMLARLCATACIYVRLHGDRNDVAHLDAFRSATYLLAPFHRTLDGLSVPDWVRAKTIYLPGITSLPARNTVALDSRSVLVVNGRGGALFDGDTWADAARALPDWTWRLIGPATLPLRAASNLRVEGWIDDVDAAIASCAVIIGAAGDGLVSAVIAAGKPFICIPEPRPYDEQMQKAKALGSCGAAIVVTSPVQSANWPLLIAEAQSLDPRSLATLGDAHGAAKAAAWLLHVADQK